MRESFQLAYPFFRGQFFAEHSAPGSPCDGLFALFHLTQKAASQIVLTAQYVGDEPHRLEQPRMR